MKVVLFTHSLLSDWNHGNAHFLRGVVSELVARGHDVDVREPRDAWSLENLVRDHGEEPVREVRRIYPELDVTRYDPSRPDLEAAVAGADLVLVHEWSDPDLVAALGRLRRNADFRLLFHDTHHRAASEPEAMATYDLSGYDGALVFGQVLREIYLERGWTRRAWVWHEAADVRRFRPLPDVEPERDLVWIGNWGDEERTEELREFLLEPVRKLGLSATVHGVRYPETALEDLTDAGIDYRGWLPNHRVPEVFARHRVTIHVPRRPYVEMLPGIPTIRPFEALACGMPLVSGPWRDTEGLFRPGTDFLVARDGNEMKNHLRALLDDPALRAGLAARGRERVLARHTCGHRVEQLLEIHRELAGLPGRTPDRRTATAETVLMEEPA